MVSVPACNISAHGTQEFAFGGLPHHDRKRYHATILGVQSVGDEVVDSKQEYDPRLDCTHNYSPMHDYLSMHGKRMAHSKTMRVRQEFVKTSLRADSGRISSQTADRSLALQEQNHNGK